MAHENRNPPYIPRTTHQLANTLRSLTETQLQMQTSRSAALDAGAIGVMGIDAAIVAIVLDAKSAHGLWIAAITLLGMSLGLAVRTVRFTGAEKVGPFAANLVDSRRAQETDRDLEWRLFEDLTRDVLANAQSLAGKIRPLVGALSLMTLAIVVELAGLIH